MKVHELIAFLQTQPQELHIVYQCYSEHALLESTKIEILNLCYPRPDGWVEYERPDKPTQPYLVFPGN